MLLAASLAVAPVTAAPAVVYTPVTTTPEKPLAANQFEVFDAGNIPHARNEERPLHRARFVYSGRDWEIVPAPPSPRRIPVDPAQLQKTTLGHRTVPVALTILFERVEAAADSDPVTLAKILRYSREAQAKFRLLKETTRRLGGVEGAEADYVQLRRGKLMRIRHWVAHYNGVACQLQLVVPYDHPELLRIGGDFGFPVRLSFGDAERKRPLLKDAEIPRRYESPYGYRVNLGGGEWIPNAVDPFIPTAEYVAYTRNQGGIAVVPVSTFGLDLETTPLLEVLLALSEVPLRNRVGALQHITEGELQGVMVETVFGDEAESIRMRAKAVRSPNQGYLAVAWINTNALAGPGVLDQWLNQISFRPDAPAYPAAARTIASFRERDRHANAFDLLGEYYFSRNDLARSADAWRTALDCRFLPALLFSYTAAQHRRGQPCEIVAYLQSREPRALSPGWAAMEFAFAQSRCGNSASAVVYYTKCLASGGYSEAGFNPIHFEDFIRCLAKEGRTKWAAERLRKRMGVDNSPVWAQMLEQLNQDILPLPSAPSALGSSDATAPTPSALTLPYYPPRPREIETGVPKLKGIIWNPTRPSAQLDSHVAFQGDSVRGYRVVKIEPDRVELVAPDGKPLTVKMSH